MLQIVLDYFSSVHKVMKASWAQQQVMETLQEPTAVRKVLFWVTMLLPTI